MTTPLSTCAAVTFIQILKCHFQSEVINGAVELAFGGGFTVLPLLVSEL